MANRVPVASCLTVAATLCSKHLEDAHMTRPVAIHAIKVQKIAHKALKALGFINLNTVFKRDHRLPVSSLPKPINLPAVLLTSGVTATRSESQPSPVPFQISVADWDLLFQAILLRLKNTVGERHSSAPPPQIGDNSGHVQIAVLECVRDMEQLHVALEKERQAQTD